MRATQSLTQPLPSLTRGEPDELEKSTTPQRAFTNVPGPAVGDLLITRSGSAGRHHARVCPHHTHLLNDGLNLPKVGQYRRMVGQLCLSFFNEIFFADACIVHDLVLLADGLTDKDTTTSCNITNTFCAGPPDFCTASHHLSRPQKGTSNQGQFIPKTPF